MLTAQGLNVQERRRIEPAIRERNRALQRVLRTEEELKKANKNQQDAEKTCRRAMEKGPAAERTMRASDRCGRLKKQLAADQGKYDAARRELDGKIGQLRPQVRKEADYLSRKSQIRSTFSTAKFALARSPFLRPQQSSPTPVEEPTRLSSGGQHHVQTPPSRPPPRPKPPRLG